MFARAVAHGRLHYCFLAYAHDAMTFPFEPDAHGSHEETTGSARYGTRSARLPVLAYALPLPSSAHRTNKAKKGLRRIDTAHIYKTRLVGVIL